MEIVTLLITAGFDVNTRDSVRYTEYLLFVKSSVSHYTCKLNSSCFTRKKEGKEKSEERGFILHNKAI